MNGKLYIKGKTIGDFSYMDRDDNKLIAKRKEKEK